MTPKPAYLELKRLIKEAWWTRTSVKTAAGGAATFRGFYGDYKVVVRLDNRDRTGTFRLEKGNRGPLKVRLQ